MADAESGDGPPGHAVPSEAAAPHPDQREADRFKADQVGAEQPHAEQVRAEQARCRTGGAERPHAEQAGAEQSEVDQAAPAELTGDRSGPVPQSSPAPPETAPPETLPRRRETVSRETVSRGTGPRETRPPAGLSEEAGLLRLVRIGAGADDDAWPEDPWLPGSRRPDRRALIIGVVVIAGLLAVASTAWLVGVNPPQASSPHGTRLSRPSQLGSGHAQPSQALSGQPAPSLTQPSQPRPSQPGSQPAPSQPRPSQPAPTRTGTGPARPGQTGHSQTGHSGSGRPATSRTGHSRTGQPGASQTGTQRTGSGQPGTSGAGNGQPARAKQAPATPVPAEQLRPEQAKPEQVRPQQARPEQARPGRLRPIPDRPVRTWPVRFWPRRHPDDPASAPVGSRVRGRRRERGTHTGRRVDHARPGRAADARRVGGLLVRYFAAVNHRRYRAYASLFAQRRQLTPREFAWGYRTSHDSNAVLVGIAALKGGLKATVTFTSHQDPAQSPDHSSCIDWRITLFLHRAGRGLPDRHAAAGIPGRSAGVPLRPAAFISGSSRPPDQPGTRVPGTGVPSPRGPALRS